MSHPSRYEGTYPWLLYVFNVRITHLSLARVYDLVEHAGINPQVIRDVFAAGRGWIALDDRGTRIGYKRES